MVTLSPLFTPVHSLVGGLMLSASVQAMLAQLGTVLGISGFAHATIAGLFAPSPGTARESQALSPKEISDRTALRTARNFTVGLLTAGAVLGASQKALEAQLGVRLFDPTSSRPPSYLHLVLIGGLVGLGTKLGSGCTSGHFLCGLSRLSPRSIVATATFFSVAVATHLLSTSPVGSSTTIAALATAEAIRLPSLGTLAVLQLPALIYAFLVPALVSSGPSSSSDASHFKQSVGASMTSFATGLHFGFGLGLTGMLRPSKVLGFLALSPRRIRTGEWDPSLAMVALGGILPAAFAYFTRIKPRVERCAAAKPKDAVSDADRPLLRHAAPLWRLPQSQHIDAKLVGGAALFGIGWGLSGLCPGPVLANLGAAAATGQGVAPIAVVAASLAAAGQLPALLA